jgi:hypothetical protein
MENKPLTKDEIEANKIILREIDKAMDLLENHLKNFCTTVAPSATAVPMPYISKSIEILKTNMRKGAGLDEETPKP